MTYYDTQQQHNSQFGPQQWAAFNSQVAPPYGAWFGAPSMQAIGGLGLGGLGGYGLGRQPMVSNTVNMAASHPLALLDTTQDGVRSLRGGASSNSPGAAASSASFRNRT